MTSPTYSEALHATLLPYQKINARITDRDAGVDELAAQIKAKGLIQPIVVRPAGKGKYQIIAGNRRHAAIGKLIAAGDWPAKQPVPIAIRDEDDAEALETSMVENVGHLPMHPVDQYECLAQLEREERSVEEMAATFGIPERQIRQRLALGNLASEIRAAWRAGKVSAEAAQAFAICPDKKLQAQAFREISKADRSFTAFDVRKRLVNDKPKLSDPRVRFVGVDRYKAAGGKVVESLFENDGYLEDGALLKSLVGERLKEKCAELIADGWSFAVPASEFGGQAWQCQREMPKPKYTPEQKARLKALDREIEQIEEDDRFDWDERDEKTAPLHTERDEIEDAGRAVGFTKAQKAKTGCVLDVSDQGVTIEWGVYPLSKGRGGAGTKPTPAATKSAKAADEDPSVLSGALTEQITNEQTAAAAKVVASHPDLALTLIVATLEAHSGKPVDISLGSLGRGRDKISYAEFPSRLKKAAKLTPDEAMQHLARLVAASLDLVSYNAHGEKQGARELIALLPGDDYLDAMRATFDAAAFFARAPGRVAIAALHEMGDTGIRSGRKDELADMAAKRAKETGWLPERLRHPDYHCAGAPKGKAKKAA